MPSKQCSNSPNRHLVTWLGTTTLVYRLHSYYADLHHGELFRFNQLKVRNEPSWEKTGPEVKKLFSCLAQLRIKFIMLINIKNTIKEMFMGRINY